MPSTSPAHNHRDGQEFAALIRQAQAGSAEAAEAFAKEFGPALLDHIRKLLQQSPRLRRMFDSSDFLQETLISIFCKRFEEELLDCPAALWSYVMKIATNRIRDSQRKYLLSERFSLKHEVPLDDNVCPEAFLDDSTEQQRLVEELAEQWLADFQQQLSPVDRNIATMILAGKCVEEIAHRCHQSPRIVRWLVNHTFRKIEQLRSR